MLGCRHMKRSLSFICCLKKGENGRNDVNYFEILLYLFIYLFNNIYTGSKYQLQKLFFLQSPV